MPAKTTPGYVTIRERVLRHINRAGGDAVESTEIRLAFGAGGVSAAHALEREGLVERIRLGVYRAKKQAASA